MNIIKNENGNGGIGFFGLLTIALIVLKLMDKVDISWLAIAGIFFATLAILLVFGFIYVLLK